MIGVFRTVFQSAIYNFRPLSYDKRMAIHVDFDASVSSRLDALEDAAGAVQMALVFLRPISRRHGGVAEMVGIGVRMLAVLDREKKALEHVAGLSQATFNMNGNEPT